MSELARVLEPISARGWPPRRLQALGQWRLQAASGFSGRANACWPIGAPDRPLEAAISAVEAWYGDQGLPTIFRPADIPENEPLRAALAARGYGPRTETLVMAGPLCPGQAKGVRLAPDPDPGFTAVFLASAEDPSDAAERIETLARIEPPRCFARIDLDGAPVAVGASALEAGWAGLFGMRTVAAYRRRGLARRVLAALSQFAADAGAQRAYLQVEAANTPAVTLYAGLGFEVAYRYRYWDRPASVGSA